MATPRERRSDITRQRILEAARKILVSKGLDGLSMRTLAQEIDYSPSAIYKYFGSKDEILQAIRDEGWALGNAIQARKRAENLPPPEKLAAAGRAYLEFAETYPEYYLLMMNTSDAPPSGMGDIAANPGFSGLPAIIQEGVASGHFKLPPGYTPLLLALQLWVTVHGIAMLKLTMMRSAGTEFNAIVEEMLKTYINSFTVA